MTINLRSAFIGMGMIFAGALILSAANQKPALPDSQNSTIAARSNDQVIFAFGGEINKTFVKYTAALTNLPKPKIC
jgi:hypothetical protein